MTESTPSINDSSRAVMESMHRLLLEALRHREQEMTRFLAILGPALIGFVWLLQNADFYGYVFLIGSVGVLLLLTLGAVYSASLGYNHRYMVLQLAKLEATMGVTSAVLAGWPRSREDFIRRYRLFGLPCCLPPELILWFWCSFMVAILGIAAVPVIIMLGPDLPRMMLGGSQIGTGPGLSIFVSVIGAWIFLIGLASPFFYGAKLKRLCESEPKSWERLSTPDLEES